MFLLQDNPIGDALNNTEWAFPLAECFHIVFFGVAIGTAVVVNLRILGALKQQPAAYLLKQTWMWTLFSLVIVIFSGLALYLSDPHMYNRNIGFHFKITMLAIAILYHYVVTHRVANSGSSSGGAKAAAIIAILLWISVVFGGLFIAFV